MKPVLAEVTATGGIGAATGGTQQAIINIIVTVAIRVIWGIIEKKREKKKAQIDGNN